jgi:hypothetical protein
MAWLSEIRFKRLLSFPLVATFADFPTRAPSSCFHCGGGELFDRVSLQTHTQTWPATSAVVGSPGRMGAGTGLFIQAKFTLPHISQRANRKTDHHVLRRRQKIQWKWLRQLAEGRRSGTSPFGPDVMTVKAALKS